MTQSAERVVTRELTINSRFCGPPDSANGGYACGVVAAEIPGAAEITLRAPPPLDTPLDLVVHADACVTLHHGPTLLAEGKPTTFELELPTPVSLADAHDATTRYSGITFPRCFVCGSGRANDGGLMILPGPLHARQLVAAPWTPTPDLADASGMVDRRFVWSALDCPSWFAHAAFAPPSELTLALLGRMSGEVERAPRIGQTCLAVGWPIKKEGRRIYSASALFDVDGNPLAWASAIWIELRT